MKYSRVWLIGAAALLGLAACAPGSAPAQAVETTVVRRGNLTVSVSGNGTVQPARTAELNFGATGTIEDVLVEEGQRVEAGDDLGRIDVRDLDQQVVQAEANLQTARAQLEQARSGNATEQDIAAQQASVAGAEANLQKARTGNVTQADIAAAQAQVRNAEAGLTRARTGNVTQADIDTAEAQVRAAEAQVEAARRGAKADQISAAQLRLTQAQETLQKTAAVASSNKTSAEQSMLQAADAVRLAQTTYTSAYWDNQQAQSGRNPRTGNTFADENLDEDVQKRQYAEALRTAELQLSQAQSQLEQARIAYDNARQQEINDVASAQAAVNDAQVQLDELLKGPEATDVTQAQAQLDQARANLAKLRQGGTQPDIAAARATLDQARANLAKLQQGGTAADIAAARAQLDQTNAQLEKLTAGAAPSDISIAEAGVTQAEAQLEAAKLSRDKAVLRAPFDGVVTAVNVSIGDSAAGAGGATGAAFTVVDDSNLHINVNVSEADVAQVQEGQTTEVSIDALGTELITGTVTYIAPAATTSQNVTTYLVRVSLPDDTAPIRVGMTASVEIGTAQKENVLIVPSSAIRSEGNRRFVRLKTGDTFEDREIQTGLSTDIEVEVTSGLSEGDEIASIGVVADS